MAIRASDGLGNRLAKYRRLAGLSAQKLADMAGFGLTRGVIANIESGRKKDITVDQLLALSAVLGIPPAALALPLEHPFQWVHLYGDEETRPVYFKSHQLPDWFSGGRKGDILAESHVGDTRIAFALLNALSTFRSIKVLHDRVVRERPSSTSDAEYEEELSAVREAYDEAIQRMQDLGMDTTDYKFSE